MFEEWLLTTAPSSVSTDLSMFAETHMSNISGQQPLPQEVFRIFLSQYIPIITQWDNKQDKVDSLLGTTDKSVVGSINEVLALVKTLGSGTAEKEVVEVADLAELYALPNPTAEVVYIIRATSEIYIFNEKNSEFINVTSKPVDNTFYVNNIVKLLEYPYDETGVFAVVEAKKTGTVTTATSYTLVVSSTKLGIVTIYTPILSDRNGWAEKKSLGLKKVWEWHNYAYQTDITRLESLIAAAL